MEDYKVLLPTLCPMKCLGFYSETSDTNAVRLNYSKEKVEDAFFNELGRDSSDVDFQALDVNFGSILTEAPEYLDFNFDILNSDRPDVVVLSAIINVEMLIHDIRQNPTTEKKQNLENFVGFVKYIHEYGHPEITFPFKYMRCLKFAWHFAEMFPYQGNSDGEGDLGSNVVNSEEERVTEYQINLSVDVDSNLNESLKTFPSENGIKGSEENSQVDESFNWEDMYEENVDPNEDNEDKSDPVEDILEDSENEEEEIMDNDEILENCEQDDDNYENYDPGEDAVGEDMYKENVDPNEDNEDKSDPVEDIQEDSENEEEESMDNDEILENCELDDDNYENYDPGEDAVGDIVWGDLQNYHSDPEEEIPEDFDLEEEVYEKDESLDGVKEYSNYVKEMEVPDNGEENDSLWDGLQNSFNNNDETEHDENEHEGADINNMSHNSIDDSADEVDEDLDVVHATEEMDVDLASQINSDDSAILQVCLEVQQDTGDENSNHKQDCQKTTTLKKKKYGFLKRKNTPYILDQIEKHCNIQTITDDRHDLYKTLLKAGLMVTLTDVEKEDLYQKRARSFRTVESTMNKWGVSMAEETFNAAINYGTVKIELPLQGEIILKSRNYKRRTSYSSTNNKKVKVNIIVYDCKGQTSCVNDQCSFRQKNLLDELVGDYRNTTQFHNVEGTDYCIYCFNDGNVENTLDTIECENYLYIVTPEDKETEVGQIVYSIGQHSCQVLYKIEIPSEFEQDFQRFNCGYHKATKNTIREDILSGQFKNINDLYSKNSAYVAGSKQGSQLKRKVVLPKSQTEKQSYVISQLKTLDPHSVLEHNDKITVLSSRRSLSWILNHADQDYFFDVCFSRVKTTSKKIVVAALYTYDEMVKMMLKLCTAYIKSENSEDVSEFIKILNTKLQILSCKPTLKFLPKSLFIDYSDVTREAFLRAGYSETEIDEMLIGCVKHWHDMLERCQCFFDNDDKSFFRQLANEWRDSGTDVMASHRFLTLRNFVNTKCNNKKKVIGSLEWWNNRPQITLRKNYGISNFKANLAEVGHSPFEKFLNPDESYLQDFSHDVEQWAQQIAHGRGSTFASGSGPSVIQISATRSEEYKRRLGEISESLDLVEVLETNARGHEIPDDTNNQHVQIETNKKMPSYRKRTTFSSAYDRNLEKAKDLEVKVLAIKENSNHVKSLELEVQQKRRRYKSEVITTSMSTRPKCNCSSCLKINARGSKTKEVCAIQLWTRLNLFSMLGGEILTAQICFTEEELKTIFDGWTVPNISCTNNNNIQRTREIILKREKKYPMPPITYTLKRIHLRSESILKMCRSPSHGVQGKKLNIINTLYIKAENTLWVPSKEAVAYENPVYLCATRECTREKLPIRCSIFSERVPNIVKVDVDCTLSGDERSRLNDENFVLE